MRNEDRLGRNTVVHLARRGVDIIFTCRSHGAEAHSLVGEPEAIGRKAASIALDTGSVVSFDCFVNDVRGGLPCTSRSIRNQRAFQWRLLPDTEQLPLIADGGRIVNISSGLTPFSMPGTSAYGSAKGG